MAIEKDGILLESGTNEVELLRFMVAGQIYAINVIKVKELLKIDNISKVPNADEAVSGISLIRGEVISVIDLMYVLEGRKNEDVKNAMTLVCEFNKTKIAFAIEDVVGISRKTWQDIQKPDGVVDSSVIIGNINCDGEIVMLLDFEKIVMDINEDIGLVMDETDVEHKDRSHIKVVLADDSPLIREVLSKTLIKAGFTDLKFFGDGKLAYDYLTGLYDKYQEKYKEHVNIVITDIEMPVMDGHNLTKRIKDSKELRDTPVIIFSSLITDSLRHKGERVGADAQISKPEVGKLVGLIDSVLMI